MCRNWMRVSSNDRDTAIPTAIPRRCKMELRFLVVLADGTWNVPATGSVFGLRIGIWLSLNGITQSLSFRWF